MIKRITPNNITTLQESEIFVFGSNLIGVHGAGAAKQALNWGAKFYFGVGLQGKTYAIPTKDKYIITLPLDKISPYVEEFIDFAKTTPSNKYLVTEIGCGLAGFTPEQIAPLFKGSVYLENIYLPLRFWGVLEKI